MAREIERKFLVKGLEWKALAYQQTHFVQGYLNNIQEKGAKSSFRIRIEGDKANINIKSLEIGLSRDEYEYKIALEDGKKMLETLSVGPIIEKVRYLIKDNQHVWEVDEFLGDNLGLVVAEVEMTAEDEDIHLLSWLGEDVTEIIRYYNVSLSQKPYKNWTEDEKNNLSK